MSTPSQLNINESLTAFSDVGVTNNPLLRNFDWNRNLNGIQVYNPKAEQFVVAPGATESVFNTLDSMSFDGTTTIAVSYLSANTYRFKFTGGTDPVFATDQALSFAATNVSVVTNPNQTVTVTANASVFGTVTSGSYIYIYSSTDTPSPAFNILNSGLWVVLNTNGTTTLTLARPAGVSFQATDEALTNIASANNMISFTLANVLVGHKVRIASPFASGSQGTYVVSAVTSKWIDITSTTALVTETGILPNTTGMIFFGASKVFCRVETDQHARVQFNGSANTTDEIEPWTAGDRKLMGWHERIGPAWMLSVVNLSTTPMVVNVFTCE